MTQKQRIEELEQRLAQLEAELALLRAMQQPVVIPQPYPVYPTYPVYPYSPFWYITCTSTSSEVMKYA